MLKKIVALLSVVALFAGGIISATVAQAAGGITITSVSPNSGPTGGGTTVTITGSGFTGATDVVFGSVPTAAWTAISDTEISAVTPSGSAGAADVMVVGALGMDILVGGFTYVDPATAPDAPTGLSATAGDGQVTLSWTAPASDGGSPITEYEVEADDGTSSTVIGTSSTATTFDATGLTNGTLYTFRVRAVNAVGSGNWSTTATATPTAAPAGPTISTVSPASGTTTGGTSVVITGTGFTDTTDVLFGSTSAVSFTVDSDTQITAITPSAGSPGTVNLTVVPLSGPSAEALDAFEYTAPATVPDAPTGLTATPGDTQVDLSWTDPASDGGSPLLGYTVVYNIVGDTPSSAFVSAPATSMTITGLTNGADYEFYVKAENAIGSSVNSNTATATPVAAATVPGAPTNLVITPGDTELGLAWDTPASDGGSPITGYRITAFDGSVLRTENIGVANTYTYTGLANGTSYDVKVYALNAVGVSTGFANGTGTPVAAATAPDAPVLSGTAGNASASLSWTVPADNGSPITGYTLVNTVTSASQSLPAGTTSINLTSMTNGATYSFVVYAVNAVGTSVASNTLTLTPTAPPAPAPAPEPQTVTVTWNANGATCDAATSTVPVGTTVNAPACTAPAGYTFLGWDREVPFIALNDTTVTAKMQKVPGVLTVTETKVLPESIKFTYAYDDSTPVDTFVIVDETGALACSSAQGTENANTCTAVSAKPGKYFALAKANGVEGPRTEVEVKGASWTKKPESILPATSVANQGSMVVRVENVEPGCQVAFRALNPGGIRKFTALRIAGDDASTSARVQFGGWRGDWTLQVSISRCPTAKSDSFEETIRVRAN